MIFFVLSRKMVFPFSGNMILFFRQKGKDDLSQKKYMGTNVFSKCSEKMVFPKISPGNMIFFVISGKMEFIYV